MPISAPLARLKGMRRILISSAERKNRATARRGFAAEKKKGRSACPKHVKFPSEGFPARKWLKPFAVGTCGKTYSCRNELMETERFNRSLRTSNGCGASTRTSLLTCKDKMIKNSALSECLESEVHPEKRRSDSMQQSSSSIIIHERDMSTCLESRRKITTNRSCCGANERQIE